MFPHPIIITLIIVSIIPSYVNSKTIETTTISNSQINKNVITDESNAINKTVDNQIDAPNVTCRGDPAYCNITKEEYIDMLNNYIFPKPHEWGLIATHSVIFVVGLVGNALVCIAVFRDSSMRGSVTYLCLVNLAVADFLVILLCLPPTVVWDVTETWFLGEILCKTLVYFQSVSVTVSVLTLTFIALDRYYAIVHPFSHRRQNEPIVHVKTTICIIWIVSLLFNCPDLITLTTVQQPLRFDLPHMVQCQPTWSAHADLVWHVIKIVFMYAVPLVLLGGAYSLIILELWRSEQFPGQAHCKHINENKRLSRRKVAKMLVAVVVMFAVCYLPVHTLSLLRYTGVLDRVNNNDIISLLALVSHNMCYVNSAINPVIYNFMSENFRHQFKRAFCCSTGSVHEHSTTLTYTAKSKPSFEMQSLTQRSLVCEMTNGYS
ncbi:orexin receptor type 2-like [Cydia pomonella]|uniref:orexin receptor type 2-like n=1 Tax=Cydia pomonella TaxID=82600 RepID=UPI002ADDF360|nr:orexin receptor type 2-like [Cydia pomonella]